VRRSEQPPPDADGRYFSDADRLVGPRSADAEKLRDDLDVEHVFGYVRKRVSDRRSHG